MCKNEDLCEKLAGFGIGCVFPRNNNALWHIKWSFKLSLADGQGLILQTASSNFSPSVPADPKD